MTLGKCSGDALVPKTFFKKMIATILQETWIMFPENRRIYCYTKSQGKLYSTV